MDIEDKLEECLIENSLKKETIERQRTIIERLVIVLEGLAQTTGNINYSPVKGALMEGKEALADAEKMGEEKE